MHQNNDDWYVLPESPELSAQYFLLYEFNLPFGLDATQQVSFDKSESRVNITLKEPITNETLVVDREIRSWLDTHAQGYDYYSSSLMLMFPYLWVSNASSMLLGTCSVLLLMSVVIGLAFRSNKLGLMSLITNIVPAAASFGVWALLCGEIGLSILIAIGMTLGIVVDKSVHLLSKYQMAYQDMLDAKGTIEYAFAHEGKALLICNGVLVAGFMTFGTVGIPY